MEILKIMGAVAGIGGLALGVYLLLYRDFIRGFFESFDGISKRHAYQLLRLFLILSWLIAVIGIVAFVALEFQSRLVLTAPSKKPIVRVVCRADGHERCPNADTFVGCGEPESGVGDLREICSRLTSRPLEIGIQAGRCGLNTWEYTCIPK